MPLPIALYGYVAIFVASLATGLTGFGLGLIATPLLILVLPPRVVIPLLLLHSVVTGCLILRETWRRVDLRRLWPLVLAGIAGVPLGAQLLLAWDADALRVFIGSIIALFGLAFLLGFRKQLRDERLACAPVGFVSGLLKGSAGMSGPPIALFFANQGMDKGAFRANIALYFMALNAVTIPTYLAGGLITPTVLSYAAASLPALLLGMLAGMKLAGRANENLFRRVILLVVVGTGLLSVATGLRLV